MFPCRALCDASTIKTVQSAAQVKILSWWSAAGLTLWLRFLLQLSLRLWGWRTVLYPWGVCIECGECFVVDLKREFKELIASCTLLWEACAENKSHSDEWIFSRLHLFVFASCCVFGWWRSSLWKCFLHLCRAVTRTSSSFHTRMQTWFIDEDVITRLLLHLLCYPNMFAFQQV